MPGKLPDNIINAIGYSVVADLDMFFFQLKNGTGGPGVAVEHSPGRAGIDKIDPGYVVMIRHMGMTCKNNVTTATTGKFQKTFFGS